MLPARVLLLVFLWLALAIPAQDYEKTPVYFSVNTAIILNRAFPGEPTSNSGQLYREMILPLGERNNVKPGFLIGLSADLGKPEKRTRLSGALNLTHTQSQYKRIYSAILPGSYGSTSNYSNVDTYIQNYFLNVGCGVKTRVAKHFFIQGIFLLHINLYSSYKYRGYSIHTEQSYYPVNSQSTPNYYRSSFSPVHTTTHSSSGAPHAASLSFALYYAGKFKYGNYQVFVFKNFSLGRTHYPWWGIGLNLPLKIMAKL